MEWLVDWFEGFFAWFMLLVQGFVGWLLSIVQSGWPAALDVFGIVLRNPETVAIGLGSGVLVVLIGLIVGTLVMRSIDKRIPQASDDEEVLDDEIDGVSDDVVDDFHADRDEIFRN